MNLPKQAVWAGSFFASTGTMTLMLIVLKACGVISWGWASILSPLWIPFAIWFSLLIATCIFALVYALLGRLR